MKTVLVKDGPPISVQAGPGDREGGGTTQQDGLSVVESNDFGPWASMEPKIAHIASTLEVLTPATVDKDDSLVTRPV